MGERDGLGKVIALRSSAGSWRDAETSAAETDRVEDGRGDLRISAGSDAVVVRFSDDQVAGHPAVPDLGPFAVVVVGTHDVRGDEDTLAVRVSRASPWQLTDKAGSGFQGTMKERVLPTATLRASRPRAAAPVALPQPRPQSPETPPTNNGTPTDSADDPAPSVWVDRATIAPNIYVSRPDKKR